MPQYLFILSQEKTWVCFSSERVNKVKPFFQVEIGVSEKSPEISKKWDK